jgi:hypothetical protein
VDRRTRNLFAVALVVVIALAGGGALLMGGGGSPASTPPAASETTEGVVVGVDATGLTNVTGFTLRADDGAVLEFGLTGLQNGVAFPPGHLAEHQTLGTRIRVWYDQSSDGTLEAVWLDDA